MEFFRLKKKKKGLQGITNMFWILRNMGLQLHEVVLRDIFNFSFYIILYLSSLFVESFSFIGFKNYNSLLIFTLHL